jgi:hypothetical protein
MATREEVEIAHKEACARDITERLQFERIWVLHRALTLNVTTNRADPAESWKSNPEEDLSWPADMRRNLLDKYYNLLQAL